MSIRAATHRLIQNGRVLLRTLRNNENLYSTEHPRNYLNKIHVVQVGKSQGHPPQGSSTNGATAGRHFGFLGSHARRLFVDNILKRVTSRLAADLRKRAARRLVFGDSAPFFALVGTSLASGSGILTKDDELEGVCWEIREAMSKLQWNMPQNDKNYDVTKTDEKGVSLQDFEIGPIIAKGCSAAVYAAKFKKTIHIENITQADIHRRNGDIHLFPLALKMMFNYDAESNATTILRAMYRETIPARNRHNNEELAEWEQRMAENMCTLPPHPNVVVMYYVFTDRVPALPDSWGMYPDALPARINPHGSGRNMSLFLLMKRYDTTLKEYLSSCSVSIRESILLLAQLLEGIVHINAHGIAHRDLKSDNILLDLSEETDNCPSLVITDFGCCLADKGGNLHMPYNTDNIDKGGNIALMAPEVISARPGPFTSINYTKADLWTAGTIAYEIFGEKNPFLGTPDEKPVLKNYNYEDHNLPPLPESIPNVIIALIQNILSRNFYKRHSPEMAATIMQLYLWAPSSWFKSENKVPSSNEVMEWLLCLTTKVLCEGRNSSLLLTNTLNDDESEHNVVKKSSYRRSLSTRSCGRRTMPEYQLIASFLGRVTLSNVRNAIRWIQKNM
ncbi:hypothetical protein KPH14_006599 [Odynerus spinipes]|uniref:non-specific serine/threonine protein kinase n=1 Tax=Odynerus spinipes TaxID=1348599 RepID=A0AAD9RQQ5_9HYME|nr:hypothetical protein KPH14_006599 [Odynerus spinipes]